MITHSTDLATHSLLDVRALMSIFREAMKSCVPAVVPVPAPVLAIAALLASTGAEPPSKAARFGGSPGGADGVDDAPADAEPLCWNCSLSRRGGEPTGVVLRIRDDDPSIRAQASRQVERQAKEFNAKKRGYRLISVRWYYRYCTVFVRGVCCLASAGSEDGLARWSASATDVCQ